ncbi:MAG: gluconate 2-dehydrogenase subunit 3 family protein [Alphaproteobacteria bacterium]|nr:gluconate 2-dehydrogenase subunit 3 family protein [Alphaproteobacteria bacterium]
MNQPAPARLGRRAFLGLGLLGGAALALGGVGLALQPGVARAPATPLQALSPRAFSVLAAVADRVCPGGEGAPGAAEVGVAEKVDALLATSPPTFRTDIEQALLLLENALPGLLLDGRARPFTACDAATQDATLEAWQTSSLGLRRQVYKGVRGLVVAAYFGSPETYRSASGYPGPPDFSSLDRPGDPT